MVQHAGEAALFGCLLALFNLGLALRRQVAHDAHQHVRPANGIKQQAGDSFDRHQAAVAVGLVELAHHPQARQVAAGEARQPRRHAGAERRQRGARGAVLQLVLEVVEAVAE